MASEFVRKVKGIRNIDILSPNITTENDLISTIDGEVYVATNKGYKKITGGETEQDIQLLEKDVKNLKTDTNNNTSEIETLKTDTNNNTSEIETLKTNTDNNTSEIETNTSEIDTLKTDTNNNTSEIETLKSEIETLKKDTSNWQKYKLTENNGDRITKNYVDVLTLESGFFDCHNVSGVPNNEGSIWFIDVYKVTDLDAKTIKATLGYTGDTYQRTIYGSSDSGWEKLTGLQDLIKRIEALEN